MSSKVPAIGLVMAGLASVGCTGVFVPKEQYDRDVRQQKDYISALERDNAENRKYREDYESLKGQGDLATLSKQAYDEMAEALKKALTGLAIVDEERPFVDHKTGAIVFTESLLFDLGKFGLSAKGREVLKRFASAHRDSRLKIVGHTDPTPIVKVSTKAALPISDTNLELSALRAVSVAFELMRNGIPERRITVEGMGSQQPRGDKRSSRRVEIFVVGRPNGKTSQR